MIARLKGKVIDYEDSRVVVDCNGVGYGVLVCNDERQALVIGSSCELFIAEQIKEDAHELFGFSSKSRKSLFLQLISVNGVGPKAGMAILNVGNENSIKSAIANGDTKYISQAVGVGKKVAERLIVDLKNKVGLEVGENVTDFLGDSSSSDEAVQAMVALGYSQQDAVLILRGIDQNLPTGDRVKLALKGAKT